MFLVTATSHISAMIGSIILPIAAPLPEQQPDLRQHMS
jgi:hypothetical protein